MTKEEKKFNTPSIITKKCSRCGQNKQLEEFHNHCSGSYGKRGDCKVCHIKNQKQYSLNNKEKIRKAGKLYYLNNKIKWKKESIKRKFNLTLDQWNLMFEKQNGKCAICEIENDKLKKGLFVDHCHKTNVVRGLLCTKCNVALGHFNDDIIILNKAIEYLKKI